MSEDESVDEMSATFTTMMNGLSFKGKKYSNLYKIINLLGSLPKAWRPKVTTEEANTLSTLNINELLSSLKVHEQVIKLRITSYKEKQIHYS